MQFLAHLAYFKLGFYFGLYMGQGLICCFADSWISEWTGGLMSDVVPDLLKETPYLHHISVFSDHISQFKSPATTQIGGMKSSLVWGHCAKKTVMLTSVFTSHVMAMGPWILSKFVYLNRLQVQSSSDCQYSLDNTKVDS